ncbi:hypothetical protein, partial [Staphylococcus aureus]|uniref:hypothetical protein n=1 Tax=Staphylococcus aureus TaxID=1280 RepID=UPI003D0AAC1C
DFFQSTFDNAKVNAKAYGTAGLGQLFGDQMLGTNFGQQYENYLGASEGVGVMASTPAPAYGGQYAQQQAGYQSNLQAIQK